MNLKNKNTMKEEINEVVDYYNNYKNRQIKVGLNIRHHSIIRYLKKNGLKKNSKVLEIGCGVGIISGALSSYTSKGMVYGIDISTEGIMYAKEKYFKRKNLKFIASEIEKVAFDFLFDLILLPDVLEHIPIEQHPEIFKKLISLLNEDGIMFINIPTANHIDYLTEKYPDKIQIIDQAINSSLIIKNAEDVGFELIKFENYSLFYDRVDYSRMIFIKRKKWKTANEITGIKKIIREMISKVVFYLGV